MNPLLSLMTKPKVVHRQVKSVFGVSKAEFEKLLSYFEPLWHQKQEASIAARWINKNRKTKRGCGENSKLPTASASLSFVLYYLKQYPTFDALGAHFEMTGARANQLLHYHCTTLQQTLEQMGVLPPSCFENAQDFQRFLKANSIKEILVDATERPIQRPKNEERQKECYSGKKKACN